MESKIKLAERRGSRPDVTPARFERILQNQIQRRKDAHEGRRLAEYKYQSIFEHVLEGIFQTTADGKYIAANPALVRMYGYESFEEMAEGINNIGSQLYVQAGRREEFIREMQVKGKVLHFESEIYRRDGRKIWISENVRSITDGDGRFLYYEGTVNDITEWRAAQEKQRQTLAVLEATRQRLESELAEAASYVRGLLPEPLTGPVETHWRYLPSSHLGGDGFGYHELDADHLAIYLLDVSGHGVGSALLCISVLNVLRSQSLATADFHDPGAVLAALNHAFPSERNNGKYFTMWYGVYHRPTRKLSFASGGHHAALLISAGGELQSLQTRQPIIGVVPDLPFTSSSVEVPTGAELYLFSDGVYEIAQPDGDWQSWDSFAEYLKEKRPEVDEVVQRMQALHGTEHFEDDFSLLKVKFG